MDPVRRAVIDVGTNSVKLLVADVAGQSVSPVFEDSEQTRLGKGFYETRILQSEAIIHTASAVTQYAGIGRLKDAKHIRVIATSAARDAVNQRELLDAIQRASGLTVEVLTGQQEAEWVYRGVRSDARLTGERLIILDVGGGSSEFIIGHGDEPEFSESFPIGSVRYLERLKPFDPPATGELAACRELVRNFLVETIRPEIAPSFAAVRPTRLIGTGGAASIIARMEFALDKYSRSKIDGAQISLDSIKRWMERLWSLSLAERKKIVGLPKKRADVILTGMAIYEGILEQFGFDVLQASTRGLRFAAVMHEREEVAS
jgi:exopolyphosphatase / guanosine-5'-triphosphate,3'-diphosphate pyrophosphatase